MSVAEQRNTILPFTWCITDTHPVCPSNYDWNGSTVQCVCACHNPKEGQ